MLNAISVDLEDWYHICGVENHKWASEWEKYAENLEENVQKILDLLNEYDVKATFFVVGYIADNNPDLIRKIAGYGHELASHGYYHRRIFDMTEEEFENDLIRSKKAIEKASGKKVYGYRAPEWSLREESEWALDILVKNGFKYDSSANPLSHLSGKKFGIFPNRIKTKYGEISEFPLTTVRLFSERTPFSGGLPMRVTPHCYIISLTKKYVREGNPVLLYLHPWEFDNTQSKIYLPLNRRIMHYFNRKVTPTKTANMLKHFNFAPLERVLGLTQSGKYTGSEMKKRYIDGVFLKSFILTVTGFLIFYIAIFSAHIFIGAYSLLIILIMLTILYWPWTTISDFIENIFKR